MIFFFLKFSYSLICGHLYNRSSLTPILPPSHLTSVPSHLLLHRQIFLRSVAEVMYFFFLKEILFLKMFCIHKILDMYLQNFCLLVSTLFTRGVTRFQPKQAALPTQPTTKCTGTSALPTRSTHPTTKCSSTAATPTKPGTKCADRESLRTKPTARPNVPTYNLPTSVQVQLPQLRYLALSVRFNGALCTKSTALMYQQWIDPLYQPITYRPSAPVQLTYLSKLMPYSVLSQIKNIFLTYCLVYERIRSRNISV